MDKARKLALSICIWKERKRGSSNGHYGGNPETYMDVGQAMGAAMAEMIKNDG